MPIYSLDSLTVFKQSLNSSFNYLNYFHEQKLRKSKKNYFYIKFFKVEFSGELKFKIRKN